MNRNRFRLPSVGAELLWVMAMFTIVVTPLFSTQIATAQSSSGDAVHKLFLPFLSS